VTAEKTYPTPTPYEDGYAPSPTPTPTPTPYYARRDDYGDYDDGDDDYVPPSPSPYGDYAPSPTPSPYDDYAPTPTPSLHGEYAPAPPPAGHYARRAAYGVPAYLGVKCHDAAAYVSACACLGVTGRTATAPTPAVTHHVTTVAYETVRTTVTVPAPGGDYY
jgi:hypothetical protein